MAPSLTRIGFRRDIRLFLTILVAFLATLILLLVAFLHSTLETARASMRQRESALAQIAAAEIPDMLRRGGDLETQLVAMRTRYGFDAVEIRLPGRVVKSGFTEGLEALERRAGGAVVRFYFDPATHQSLRRRFVITASVSIFATALGVVLLLFYLPHILRPIEALLDHAKELGERREGVDEASYLIESFRTSVATLKKQEAELKILHEREKRRADDLQTITSTLTRSLGSGFIAFDRDGQVLDMNTAGREILALGEETVTGKSVAELGGDSEFAGVLAESIAERRAVSRKEVTYKDRTIGLTTVPLVNAEETFLGTLTLFTDLTTVRRLEARVREMQTLADLGVMSGGIAHEFRNSLSTILGLLKLAQRTQPPPEVSAKLEAAQAEANALAGAVTSLLNFARPMNLQVGDAALGEIAESIVARLREAAPEVSFVVSPDDTVVEGDVALLSRALENIIRNAIDAVAENEGPREVRIDVSGARVTVADNGRGIAEADPTRLFLPFYSTKPGGVGLGLPLARKILLLHGASLRLDPREGGGTVVTIDFDGEGVASAQGGA